MTNDELRGWRARLGLSQATAAGRLGISPRMFQYYEAGTFAVSRTVELAARAVESGLDGDRDIKT